MPAWALRGCCSAATIWTTSCSIHDPVHGQERGIFWIEVGVAVTVSGVMLKIFYMFAGRTRDPED